jgi:hypothetical protein
MCTVRIQMRLSLKVGNKWKAKWSADVTPVTCAMGPSRSLEFWNCSMPRKCNLHQQGTTNEVSLAHKPLSLPFRCRYNKWMYLSHSLSRLGVTYKTGFGLDDWIYRTTYIYTLWTTGNIPQSLFYSLCSSTLHTDTHKGSQSSLVVSWQRIYQSYLHFKWRMKSFFFFFAQSNSLLGIPKTRLHSIPVVPSSYPGRLASRNSTLHVSRLLFRTAAFCVPL